jgi:hypothetical protein
MELNDTVITRLRAAMSGESPLAALGEEILPDGAEWAAESPGGRLWVVRWFSGSGSVAGMDSVCYATRFRGKAGDLQAARREALRIAGLIGDGKTREGQ